MAATPGADEEPAKPAPRTLGDLLYVNLGRVRVEERVWRGLLEAVAAGDQAALYALYARTHRIVFTSILRIVKLRETAEELTVDVFHDVWRRAGSYEASSGTVVGWIMNQARSRAIDRLRFETRKKRTNPYPEEGQGDEAIHSSEALVDAQTQARVLSEALVALTSGEREAIETAYFSECTYVEVAERLKVPLGTVKTRIRSALAKMRQIMTAKGVDP
jgi:RNA polymerase sigma-70 factor (ECF subfamily)